MLGGGNCKQHLFQLLDPVIHLACSNHPNKDVSATDHFDADDDCYFTTLLVVTERFLIMLPLLAGVLVSLNDASHFRLLLGIPYNPSTQMRADWVPLSLFT